MSRGSWISVTMKHLSVTSCFLESVDKAALSCPLCRLRVSTWARINSKKNTLVNDQLWRQIQTHFPQHCERRRSGRGDEDDLGVSSVPMLSRPGELQQEYQDQVTKMTEEKRALDEEQRKESEVFIQRLLEEEQTKLREEEKRREEDERLARQLSSELNATPESRRPADITAASRKKEVVVGQIDKFFPRPSKLFSDCSPTSTSTSNKENIISDLDRREPTTNRTEVPHRSHLTAPTPPTKRKVSELEAMDEDNKEAMAKRGRHTSSCQQGAVLCSPVEAEWEAELLSRQQQEDEDRRLALLLQKELDQEERRRVSDRSKGSADAYLLRESREKREEPGSKTPKTPSRRTSKSSSSTTPSSSRTCSKQTTLTEMFSSR